MKKKESGNWWYKTLFFGMVLSAFALVGSNIYILVATRGTISNLAECLISNIISIFGIAVTTWVGLSVVDRLDKKSIIDLNYKVAEINRYLDLSEREAFQALLRDLEHNRGNAITYWISSILEDIDENAFFGILWLAMRKDEDLYRLLHRDKTETSAIECYNALIKQINQIRRHLVEFPQDGNNQTIEMIVSLRETEAHFLIGYRAKGKASIAKFISAIDYYRSNAGRFGFEAFVLEKSLSTISEITTPGHIKTILDSSERQSWPVWAYISNLIGESYSKIIHYNNSEKEGDHLLPEDLSVEQCDLLAVGYCRQATIIAEKAHCERETYYRNLGCAIERTGHGNPTVEILASAIAEYKKAIIYFENQQKILSCLTSAYGKIYDALSKKGESPDFKFWNEYFQFQRLYVSSYPQILDSHVRAATYYRNKYCSLPSTPDPKKIETVRHLAQEAYIVSIFCSEGTKHYIYQDAQEICRKECVTIPPQDHGEFPCGKCCCHIPGTSE